MPNSLAPGLPVITYGRAIACLIPKQALGVCSGFSPLATLEPCSDLWSSVDMELAKLNLIEG